MSESKKSQAGHVSKALWDGAWNQSQQTIGSFCRIIRCTIGTLYHRALTGDLPLSSLHWRYRFTSLESRPSDSGMAPEIRCTENQFNWPTRQNLLTLMGVWSVTRIVRVCNTPFPQKAASDYKTSQPSEGYWLNKLKSQKPTVIMRVGHSIQPNFYLDPIYSFHAMRPRITRFALGWFWWKREVKR